MLLGSIGLRAKDFFFAANLAYFLMLLFCGVNIPLDAAARLDERGRALPAADPRDRGRARGRGRGVPRRRRRARRDRARDRGRLRRSPGSRSSGCSSASRAAPPCSTRTSPLDPRFGGGRGEAVSADEWSGHHAAFSDPSAISGGLDAHQLEALFDSLPIPFLVGRASDRRVLAANRAFVELTGYELDEIVGDDTAVPVVEHQRGRRSVGFTAGLRDHAELSVQGRPSAHRRSRLARDRGRAAARRHHRPDRAAATRPAARAERKARPRSASSPPASPTRSTTRCSRSSA